MILFRVMLYGRNKLKGEAALPGSLLCGRNSMSEKEVLIFMHIPKTGGTTLRRIIDKQYKPNEIYRTYKNVVKPQGKMTDQNIRCIQGHDYFGIHKQINKPYKYVTMLRDPVERVISNYYYSRQFIENCPSFEEFIKQNRNMQTLFATGEHPANLEEAKRNLSTFAVVGITEIFFKSVYLIGKECGWENISYYKKLNVNDNRPKRNEVPKKILNLIIEMNQLDIELYNWAKENFMKKRI